MIWVLLFYVKESNYFEEGNTIAPAYIQEKAATEGKVPQELVEQEVQKERIVAEQEGDKEVILPDVRGSV